MNNQPLYQIKDWERLYENSRSRTIEACNWVPLPNKQDGLGYCQMVTSHGNGTAHYGVWVTLVCLCSKQRLPRQGYLTDDGTDKGRPLNPEDLALITRSPAEMIAEALPRFVEIGWMDEITVAKATSLPPDATSLPPDATSLPPLARKEGMQGRKEHAATDVPALFIQLSEEYHSIQRKRFLGESCWKTSEAFEKTVADGAIEIERLHRLDGWTNKEITRVLQAVLKNEHWRPNIKSLRGIRRKSPRNGALKIENARTWIDTEGQSTKNGMLSYDQVLDLVSQGGLDMEKDFETVEFGGETLWRQR